jgi:hypothetical protein
MISWFLREIGGADGTRIPAEDDVIGQFSR